MIEWDTHAIVAGINRSLSRRGSDQSLQDYSELWMRGNVFEKYKVYSLTNMKHLPDNVGAMLITLDDELSIFTKYHKCYSVAAVIAALLKYRAEQCAFYYLTSSVKLRGISTGDLVQLGDLVISSLQHDEESIGWLRNALKRHPEHAMVRRELWCRYFSDTDAYLSFLPKACLTQPFIAGHQCAKLLPYVTRLPSLTPETAVVMLNSMQTCNVYHVLSLSRLANLSLDAQRRVWNQVQQDTLAKFSQFQWNIAKNCRLIIPYSGLTRELHSNITSGKYLLNPDHLIPLELLYGAIDTDDRQQPVTGHLCCGADVIYPEILTEMQRDAIENIILHTLLETSGSLTFESMDVLRNTPMLDHLEQLSTNGKLEDVIVVEAIQYQLLKSGSLATVSREYFPILLDGSNTHLITTREYILDQSYIGELLAQKEETITDTDLGYMILSHTILFMENLDCPLQDLVSDDTWIKWLRNYGQVRSVCGMLYHAMSFLSVEKQGLILYYGGEVLGALMDTYRSDAIGATAYNIALAHGLSVYGHKISPYILECRKHISDPKLELRLPMIYIDLQSGDTPSEKLMHDIVMTYAELDQLFKLVFSFSTIAWHLQTETRTEDLLKWCELHGGTKYNVTEFCWSEVDRKVIDILVKGEIIDIDTVDEDTLERLDVFQCSICLMHERLTHAMCHPCGHEFHRDCLKSWVRGGNRTCPLCRGQIERITQQSAPVPERFYPDIALESS